jgi:hypothetical protein
MDANDPEAHVWYKVTILWLISALHWANENLPTLIGWGTLIYTVLQIAIAIKKYRDKPAN